VRFVKDTVFHTPLRYLGSVSDRVNAVIAGVEVEHHLDMRMVLMVHTLKLCVNWQKLLIKAAMSFAPTSRVVKTV
jgi:hypothetical protein